MHHLRALSFLSFSVSPVGRLCRALFGAFLISIGLAMESATGNGIAAMGWIATLAAAFDLCVLGPLFGGPFRGDHMRESIHDQQGLPIYGSRSLTWTRA